VDVIVDKTFNAVEATGVEIVGGGGGVLANRRLRERLQERADERGVGLFVPEPALCTDNGAMIALRGAQQLAAGRVSALDLDVHSSGDVHGSGGT